MNTHLKGRIFQAKGINYLVLHEDSESDDYVLVRALNSRRRVERIATTTVMQYLVENSPYCSTETSTL